MRGQYKEVDWIHLGRVHCENSSQSKSEGHHSQSFKEVAQDDDDDGDNDTE